MPSVNSTGQEQQSALAGTNRSSPGKDELCSDFYVNLCSGEHHLGQACSSGPIRYPPCLIIVNSSPLSAREEAPVRRACLRMAARRPDGYCRHDGDAGDAGDLSDAGIAATIAAGPGELWRRLFAAADALRTSAHASWCQPSSPEGVLVFPHPSTATRPRRSSVSCMTFMSSCRSTGQHGTAPRGTRAGRGWRQHRSLTLPA